MSTARGLRLASRYSTCRGSLVSGHSAVFRAAFSTSVQRCTTANAMSNSLQKSDKKHQTSTNSTAPVKGAKTPVVSGRKKAAQLAQQAKAEAPKSNDEMLKQLEQLSSLEHIATFDVWAQPVDTFDLHIPSLRSPRKDASILDHVKVMWATQTNWIRNTISLYRMAKERSFSKVKSPWSLDLFKTQSTPWLAAFRQEALDTYKQVNRAVAEGDDKTVKKFAVANYQSQVLQRLNGRDPSHVYVWKFHGENEPCKVVSIRANQTHLGKQEPKFGNRLLVQALVKFDTNQSLQVYNKKGVLLAGDEKPRRVVEYLAFQKRMWYDKPWNIRDQLYETLEGKYKPYS